MWFVYIGIKFKLRVTVSMLEQPSSLKGQNSVAQGKMKCKTCKQFTIKSGIFHVKLARLLQVLEEYCKFCTMCSLQISLQVLLKDLQQKGHFPCKNLANARLAHLFLPGRPKLVAY